MKSPLLIPSTIAALAFAATALSSPARAGLPDKKTDRAGWIKGSMEGKQAKFCGPVEPKKLSGGSDPDFVTNQVKKQWEGVALTEIKLDTAMFLANAICKFPGNPDLQKELMPLWTSWTTFYGFGPKDLADVATAQDPNLKRLPRQDRGPKDARLSEVDARTQVLVAKDNLVTAYGMDFMSYAEILDTTPTASEHLKVAFVEKCVDSYHGSIARWAICKADALSLDRKRFDKELAAATMNPGDRLEAKLRFVQLQKVVADRAAKFQAEAAKDDGVTTVIETLPATANKQWDTESAANGALLAWTYKLVDDSRANNKKFMNGCEDELRIHLASYLTAKAPRTADDMKNAFRDNIGSQLGSAAARCFVRNKAAQSYWATMSSGFASYWGPRTTTWHALVSKKIEFDVDRGRDPLGLPKPVILYANASSAGSSGTIASMKESGDGFELTFKKETWKETVCKQWKETDRVDGIDLKTGKLIYRSYCAKTGTETRESTATPVTVAKSYAEGLKVGVAASFVRDGDGNGYPTAIFSDKKRTKIVGAFGVLY